MRIFLSIFILLIIIIISWYIFKRYYLYDKVCAGIEQSISDNIENDYEFTLDSVEINWMSASAQLKRFNAVWLNETDTVGYFIGDIELHLNGWMNLLFSKQKRIKNIVINQAEIYYAFDHPLIIKSKTEKDAKAVKVSNASVTGQLLLAKKHKEQPGEIVAKFDVTSTLNYNNTDTFSIAHFINQIHNFQFSDFHYYLPDGFYQLSIADIAFSKFDEITLKQVIVKPIHSRKSFAQKKKVATDYISVAIDSIQLIDLHEQINERIFIDHIHVHQPSIDLFRDKNYPDNQKHKAIFVDLIREIKSPLYIREVDINSMFIKYNELAKEGEEAGHLFFSEATANILNITNVEDSLKLYDKILIKANAKFYGAGKLTTSISYDLLPGPGRFRITGSLSPMDIRKTNDILDKLLPAKVKSGQLNKLRFNFSGTRTHSEGDMWFDYSDLKIEVLEVKQWDNKLTRNVMSGIGNMLLRKSNPAANGTFRVGDINQDRDTTKSMFHYWWISLRSGFLSSVGVTAEKKIINYKSGEDATFKDKIGLGDK